MVVVRRRGGCGAMVGMVAAVGCDEWCGDDDGFGMVVPAVSWTKGGSGGAVLVVAMVMGTTKAVVVSHDGGGGDGAAVVGRPRWWQRGVAAMMVAVAMGLLWWGDHDGGGWRVVASDIWDRIDRQYQNKVNELRAEKLARSANPLALVATAQASQDPFYQSSRSHRSQAPSLKPSIPSRSHTSTRHKGKEIAKPITPPSETASEEDSDPEQAQRDKDMQKNLALIAKYFKKIYKPTNNNLRTSSSSKNKNEKMLLCKQAEQGVPLQAEQYDWLEDTDEGVDEQELEAHYSYMAKIQEVPNVDSGTDSEPVEHVQNNAGYNVFANELQHSEQSEYVSNTCLVETDDSNVTPDSPDMCEDDIQNEQNDVESDDECTEFEKYKAFNDRTIDYDKLERKLNKALGQLAHKDNVVREGLKTKAYELSVVKEKHDELMKQSLLTKSHYEGLVKQKTKTQSDSLKFVHELKKKMHADFKYVESLEKEIDKLESKKAEFSDMYDVILHDCVSKDVMCSYLQSLSDLDALAELQYLKAQMQDKNIAISGLKKLIKNDKGKYMDTKFDRPSVVRQPNAQRIPKPLVLGVNHKPNVSRPQLKSNQSRDKVLPNNSQVKVKETQVEVHPRILSDSNKMKSVTACKDSLNSRTLNANAIFATCNKCLVDSNYFACVTKMLNDVHARTKKPNIVPISTRKPKHQGNKSVVTSHKKKFAPIRSYGYLVQGNVTINRVYYVEGLNHNLFSVGQFCDADLEVAFRKSTCFVRDYQGNDLLIGNRRSDLYTISLQESTSSTPLCLMAKATPTQAWLWHRRLSHLNFDYINLLSKKDIVIGLPKLKYVKDQLCSFCELSKAKRISFKSKAILSSKGRLNLLHMDLYGPMRVASINGKKYILKSSSPVIAVRTDRGIEFLNKTLNAFFKEEGIKHQTSTARTPEQNGAVKRRNHTLVEAARTMLSASQLPLFFWAEAIATACYTQNRSIIIPNHDKTPYHIINDRKPFIKHLHIFGCICYITRDGKNLDKMKEKGDQCILVGYSTQSKGYRVYNKRTRMIVESIHIRFDEIKEVSETFVANNTSGLQMQMFHHNKKEGEQLQDDEFTNPFCAPAQEEAESSSHNIGNTNVPTFNQPQVFEYQWTKDHLLGQVRGNPSRPVQTRRQLATDPEMCMFALTMSTAKSKNIKEAMADSAWIEAMQEELHQFDRLQVRIVLNFIKSAKNQAKYTLEILHKHGMDKGQSIGTPMATKPKLDADLSGNPVDQTDYHSKIESLMYLTSSRPDIVQAVCFCARYQSQPTEKHLKEVKRIFRYLRDADHTGCIDSRKSTSEGIQFLGDKLVSWMSKKQNCTVMSSTEAEYVALSASCAQVMWMWTQLQDYGFNYNKIPLYCDS
nr:retrovirus-related Pol polyprotein from transposon TNT 1-94 [Tanacetum cinerariifolium]